MHLRPRRWASDIMVRGDTCSRRRGRGRETHIDDPRRNHLSLPVSSVVIRESCSTVSLMAVPPPVHGHAGMAALASRAEQAGVDVAWLVRGRAPSSMPQAIHYRLGRQAARVVDRPVQIATSHLLRAEDQSQSRRLQASLRTTVSPGRGPLCRQGINSSRNIPSGRRG